MVQYLFAYYAELGKRDGIWVKIVVKDLFCKYINRKEMILFLRDLVDARNEISHARYIQSTVDRVESVLSREELTVLCSEVGISDKLPFDPFSVMAGR